MQLFAAFHTNLAFSSIPPSHYGWVLDSCYWPLLDLSESLNLKIGLEFSGQTLHSLLELDPLFIEKVLQLAQIEMIEPICGGEYQSIGPLMPPEDNPFNYQTGRETFRRLLNYDSRLLYLPE